MSFFSKVKSIASKGIKVLSDVKTAAVEYATAPSSASSMAQSTLPPYKEIIHLAQQVLEIIDHLSQSDPYSLETDKRLHESKIRMFVGRIIYLLQVESSNESMSTHNDDDERASPCFDIFVSSNFIAAVITRGLIDKPRGCLPLVMCVVADLLRNVPYPLLPLQSIYKPVSKLISNAMRYDAVHNNANLICSGGVYNKNEYSAYKRRIEISLNVLLSVIWRKISENPPILEYFIVSDSTRSEKRRLGKELSQLSRPLKLTQQIDILSALVTTLLKPKTTLYAQESLYISLYMRSSTITHFVVNHTNLLLALVNEVCKRYVAALDYLIESNTGASGGIVAPVARYASPLSKNDTASAGIAAGAGVSSLNALEAFVNVFKLCVTVYGLLLNNVHREMVLQSSRTNNNVAAGGGGLTEGGPDSTAAAGTATTPPQAVGQLILDNYNGYFLYGTLHYSLTASGDVQLLSAYSLVRRLLLELRAGEEMNGENDCPSEYSLTYVTTQFLCGHFLKTNAASGAGASAATTTVGGGEGADVPTEEALLSGDAEAAAEVKTTSSSGGGTASGGKMGVDYLSSILTRCSSVNKPLSVSAVQLVSVLLSLSSLPTTINACCNRSRAGGSDTTTNAATATAAQQPSLTISMMMAGRPESVDHIINAFVANLVPTIYQTYTSDSTTATAAPVTPAKPNTTTTTTSAAASAPIVSPSSAASLTPAPSATATTAVTAAQPTTLSGKIRVGAFSRYVDIAAAHILYRLSGHLTDILDHRETSGKSSLFPALIDAATARDGAGGSLMLSSHNALYEMLLRKLSGFMTLKTDEQIALSGLLQQYMGVLCILVITSTESAASVLNGGVNAKSCFGQIVEILQHLDALFNGMKVHVGKLSNGSNKLAAMKKLLQNTALQRIDDHLEKKRQIVTATSGANSYSGSGYEDVSSSVESTLPPRSVNRINSLINNTAGGVSSGSTHGNLANTSTHGQATVSGSRRMSSVFGSSGSAGNSSSNTPTSSSHGGGGSGGSSSVNRTNASSSSGSGTGGVGAYVAYQSAEYKYLEKEPPQVKQILETANYILELRAEMRAFVFAVQILKSQFIHVRQRQSKTEDDLLFEGVVLDATSDESDADGGLDEETISDLADIDELRQIQTQISSCGGESSGGVSQLQRTNSSLYGQGKRLTYWNNLDARETDFLQEYEVLNSSLEDLVASSSSIVVF